jgi:hypothetical protein
VKKKTLTLKEKIDKIWNDHWQDWDRMMELTLRLIRSEQKRKCGECQYRKNYLKSVYGTKK